MVRSDVSYLDRKLREEVSEFLANYDYHPRPRVELYCFAQRFTDSFLSIKARYEVGTGVRYRFGSSKTPSSAPRPLDLLDDDTIKRLEKLELKVRPQESAKPASEAELVEARALAASLKRYQHILREKRSTVLYAIAITLFKEFEQGEITSRVATPVAPDFDKSSITKTFQLPAENRYRIVLRPSAKWHPVEPLTCELVVYFKFPIFEPYRARGRFDWRSDAEVSAKIKLAGGKELGQETANLHLRFEQRFDSVPPHIDDATIQSELADGHLLRETIAQRTHQLISMGISVDF